jgi:hypothetical protein
MPVIKMLQKIAKDIPLKLYFECGVPLESIMPYDVLLKSLIPAFRCKGDGLGEEWDGVTRTCELPADVASFNHQDY